MALLISNFLSTNLSSAHNKSLFFFNNCNKLSLFVHVNSVKNVIYDDTDPGNYNFNARFVHEAYFHALVTPTSAVNKCYGREAGGFNL